MAGIGKIAGPAGERLAKLEAKQADAQARKRDLERALRDARARAEQLDGQALDDEAGVLAGVRTKTDLARTRKALDAAAAEAGADASREAKVAARACELVDTELSEYVRERLDELLGAVRDHGAGLEDRLRSHLDAALAALEAVSAHEAQLMRLLLAAQLGTQGVVTVTEHQRDLRRSLRAALDNGTVRAARFQSDPPTYELIPPLEDDE